MLEIDAVMPSDCYTCFAESETGVCKLIDDAVDSPLEGRRKDCPIREVPDIREDENMVWVSV